MFQDDVDNDEGYGPMHFQASCRTDRCSLYCAMTITFDQVINRYTVHVCATKLQQSYLDDNKEENTTRYTKR